MDGVIPAFGEVTIAVLALDREELGEMGRDRLRAARQSKQLVSVLYQLRGQQGSLDPLLESLLEEHETSLNGYLDPATEYSSMLRAALV